MSDDEYEEEYEYEEGFSGDEEENLNSSGNGACIGEIPGIHTTQNSSKSVAPFSPSVRNTEVLSNSPASKLVDFDDVAAIISAQVADMSSLLEVDVNIAQFLLQASFWKKERVIEGYFADCDELMTSTGVNLYDPAQIEKFFSRKSDCSSPKKAKGSRGSSVSSQEFTCTICYDNFNDLECEGFSLGCKHPFCKDCFREYLKSKVS